MENNKNQHKVNNQKCVQVVHIFLIYSIFALENIAQILLSNSQFVFNKFKMHTITLNTLTDDIYIYIYMCGRILIWLDLNE